MLWALGPRGEQPAGSEQKGEPVARSVFDRLKERGEEVLNQLSNDLMANPHFVKAMQSAVKGKEKLEEGVEQALRGMNIHSRTEFKKALSKSEALERELAVQKAAVEGLAVKASTATPARASAARPASRAPRKKAARKKAAKP